MILKKIKPISYSLLQFNNFHSSSKISPSANNLFNASKLLSTYFKLGRVEHAKKLFEEIPEKNIVFWSIMVYGYATNGFLRESVKTFSEMRVRGTVPNSFTIVGVLFTAIGLLDPVLGQSVHALIVKIGLESNTIVGTAMFDTYAKCGNITDSYYLFKQMKDPGLISCNAMVAGFIHNELFEEALVLFNQFRLSGLVPNSVTVLSLIRGCNALESVRFGQSIHGLVVKTGLYSNISVINAVLDMYSSFRDLEAATHIFEKMISKDVVSWTTMISLLVHLEYATDALKLFCRMRDNGVNLDPLVLVNIVRAFALLGDLKLGRTIHAHTVISGFGWELPVANSVIAMYSNCGDLCSSVILFDRMMEKSLVSWTAMISGCVQNGRSGEALDLLVRMRVEEDFNLDPVILISILTACGELARLGHCQQLHCYVYKSGFQRYKSVQNSLVSTYSKCGDVELAHKVFRDMDYLDIVSWNAIISGYGINGRGEVAVALFREMENVGEDPDCVTYLSVLTACSHSGLVDDGLMIFNQMMEEKKIMPSGEHCGCIVDMLARAGRLCDARSFLSKLSERVGPNVWRAFLGGCRTHINVELAEWAADRVFQLDPKESGHVVLLSNVYASVGRFEDADVLRLSMQMKGLMKDPGISLLNGMPQDIS